VKKRSWFLRLSQNYLIPISVTAVFLIIWQISSRAGILSQLFLPAPSLVFSYLRSSVIDGELTAALSATLGRIGAGFLLGAIPGLFLGWAMGWSSRLRKYIDPFVAALYPIPKIAIFPLIMFIFGIGEISKVIAIAISAFFPLLINTIAGVRQINPVYLEVARNYGANRWKTLWNVILPGSLPMVLAGVRIALNTSLLIAIAVEMVAAEVGLGVMIWFAWQTLRIEQLYAALFVIAFLGIGLNIVLEWITHRIAPWHTRTSQDEGS
jgi:ABC-type nitrate/sulfonate/bicarbonate transport system permease component